MGNLSHTVGGTDNLVSFKSAARVPIDSLKVHFKPIQEGEGDPSPENIRPISGWNGVEIYRDGDKKTRQVTWNQWCKPLNDENWRAYNTANNDIQFENGIATSIWLQNKSGYNASIRLKTGIPQRNKEVWYVSYMIKPSISGLTWGVEYNGGLQHTCAGLVGTDTWTRCSDCDLYYRGTNNYVYISYCRSSSVDLTGLVTQTKAPLLINLTQMFGYGNEPSKEEFETQCLLNGIDLTEAFPYDEGHVMEWKTSTANIKYHIPISVPEKNLFNIDAPYAEPSNTDYGDLATLRTFQPYTYCTGLKYANIYYPTAVSNFSRSNGTISFTTTVDKYFGVCYAIPLSYGTYTITYTANNATADISLYDKDGAFIENHINQSTFTVSKNSVMAIIVFRAQTIDIPSTVSDVQIVEGVKTIEYKSFDPDNAVYGGHVDLVKGEVVAEWIKVKKKLSECSVKNERNEYVCYDFHSLSDIPCYADATSTPHTIRKEHSMCSLGYHSWSAFDNLKPHYYIFKNTDNNTTRALLFLPTEDTESDDIEFELAFRLETPIHYPLTGTQLKTFLNQNNFWSNTNDVTEVSYAIHDTAPIRAAKKRIMAASPHLETASDNLVSFNTDVAAPLKECKVEFKPKQDLHGYNGPWVGGTGKNLLRVSADNRIGVMGNATETDTGFNIGNGNINGGYLVKVKPNTTYVYSYTSTYNGSCMHGRIWGFTEKPDSSTSISIGTFLINKTSWTGSATFTTDENTNWVVAGAYAYDKGLNSSLTNMQVEESSVASTYEPYENICPIEGWNELEIYRANKNLIPFKKYQYLCDVNYYNGYSGWVNEIKVNTLPRNVNLTYSVYLDCTNCTDTNNDNRVAIWIMQNNGKYRVIIGNVIKNGNSGISSAKVTLYDTDDWVAFGLSLRRETSASDPIVEVGDEITKPVEHDSTVIPITFPSDAGTIYGGYVDLIKGKLIQEWIQVKINSLSWTYMNSGECFRSTVPMERVGYKETSPVRSSIYKTLEVGSTISSWVDREDCSISEHLGNSVDALIQAIHIKDSRYTTVSDFLNGVGNENIVYKLLTPIEYSLTSQTLKTLCGTNNIWSTSNGPISIKYWKH